MTLLRQRMLDDLRIRNYSPSTVECYIREVAEFAKHFGKSPEHLGPEEIRSWQLYLLKEKRVGTFFLHSGCLQSALLLPKYAAPKGRDRADSATAL